MPLSRLQYPLTPEYIRHLPVGIVDIFTDIEDYMIADICSRLVLTGATTATAANHILELMRRGYNEKALVHYISKKTGLAEKAIEAAVRAANRQAWEYYTALYNATGTPLDGLLQHQYELDALVRATEGELKNLTRSLGFCFRYADGRLKWYSPSDAYQHVLGQALMKVNAGVSFNQAICEGISELTDKGITSVEYLKEEGPVNKTVNHIDVAVRRAVNTGVTKMAQAYAERAMDDIGTSYLEVTAHAGARDVDGPNPWSNHDRWQGKVYRFGGEEKEYPNVYDVCGLGEVDGLCGVNCRHTYHPFIPGITERTYTDEDLQNLKAGWPKSYGGKKYTQYEAHQAMRKAETTMRALKRKMIGESASGDKDRYLKHAAKFKALDGEYKKFTNAMGLRSQRERGNIIQWGPAETAAAEKALTEVERQKVNT